MEQDAVTLGWQEVGEEAFGFVDEMRGKGAGAAVELAPEPGNALGPILDRPKGVLRRGWAREGAHDGGGDLGRLFVVRDGDEHGAGEETLEKERPQVAVGVEEAGGAAAVVVGEGVDLGPKLAVGVADLEDNGVAIGAEGGYDVVVGRGIACGGEAQGPASDAFSNDVGQAAEPLASGVAVEVGHSAGEVLGYGEVGHGCPIRYVCLASRSFRLGRRESFGVVAGGFWGGGAEGGGVCGAGGYGSGMGVATGGLGSGPLCGPSHMPAVQGGDGRRVCPSTSLRVASDMPALQ